MTEVAVTGGAGRIAGYLREADGGLPALGWTLRLIDRDADADGAAIAGVDLTADDAIERLTDLFTGCDAVVHLGGIPTESDWPAILATNIDGTYRVLEAARRAAVRRVVLASSNHAVGYHPVVDGPVPGDVAGRPDSFYGVSKVALEALGSLYADKYGLEIVSLRIGQCAPRPLTTFDLAIWLSPADAVRLVDAALRGPVTGPATVWGISANARGWWDLTGARALGHRPQDDAERWADQVTPYTGPPDVLGHDMVATDPLS